MNPFYNPSSFSLLTLNLSDKQHIYWLEKRGEMIYDEINDQFFIQKKIQIKYKIKGIFYRITSHEQILMNK